MPVPKGKRTPEVINNRIIFLTRERDMVAGEFRSQLVDLTNEYDTAIGREAAQKKYDSMSKPEKVEFARLIKENG